MDVVVFEALCEKSSEADLGRGFYVKFQYIIYKFVTVGVPLSQHLSFENDAGIRGILPGYGYAGIRRHPL